MVRVEIGVRHEDCLSAGRIHIGIVDFGIYALIVVEVVVVRRLVEKSDGLDGRDYFVRHRVGRRRRPKQIVAHVCRICTTATCARYRTNRLQIALVFH